MSDSHENLKIELGNHAAFPVAYLKGQAPTAPSDLALSVLNAEMYGLDTGDTLRIIVDGNEQNFRISGIYSDITNGGKTAKGAFDDKTGELAWTVAYVEMSEKENIQTFSESLKLKFSDIKVSSIQDFVSETFGHTVTSIRNAAWISMISALAVLATITVLFLRLLIAKDRYSIAVFKALGFTSRDIAIQYRLRFMMILGLGIVLGILLSVSVGEKIAGIAVSSLGAASFKFTMDYLFTFFSVPLLMITLMHYILSTNTSIYQKISISQTIKELS